MKLSIIVLILLVILMIVMIAIYGRECLINSYRTRIINDIKAKYNNSDKISYVILDVSESDTDYACVVVVVDERDDTVVDWWTAVIYNNVVICDKIKSEKV